MAAGAGNTASVSPSVIAPLSFACVLSPPRSFHDQLQPAPTNVDGSTSGSNKRKRRPAGTPDPDAEVVALSPRTLLESDRYICDICSQGFQRDQNLQMHRRRHKVPWKLLKKATTDMRKRVYVCPEPTCLHHDPTHALGDLVGIKKHYRRKHSTDKQWKCEKCSKGYAVQSDYKAHLKTCGTRGHCCDCGRVFSRVESFIEHQDTCVAAKEKSQAGIHIGLVNGGQQNRRFDVDSPSSTRSLSTDCPSVDPSRSALSDSATMPSCSEVEYGAMAASRSPPPAGPHQWVILGTNRELQLLPEGENATSGSSRPSMIMHMLSNPANDSSVALLSGVRGNNPSSDPSMSVQSGDELAGKSTEGEGGPGDRECMPRLQLSIGPYSATEDIPSFGEKQITFTGGLAHASFDDHNARTITTAERAPFSHGQQQQRLHRIAGASDGSTTAIALGGRQVGASKSPHEISLAPVRSNAEVLRFDESNNKDSEGLGDPFRKSSTSQPCFSIVRTSLLDAEKHSLSVARSTFSDCTGAWDQSNKQQLGNIFTPIIPPVTNVGARLCDSEKMAPMVPLHSHNMIHNEEKVGDERAGAAGAVHGVDLEVTSEGHLPTGEQDLRNAWSELAVARRTKAQARVELEEAESQLAQAEMLKQEAREQMKLASAAKSYADHARETAKRQRELAESELSSAKRAREQAQSEIVRAQMLKEHADSFVGIASRRSSAPFPEASMNANCQSSGATCTPLSTEPRHDSYHHHQQRQVPSSSKRNFASLPESSFSSSSTLSSLQVLPYPRYSSSSMITPTFTGIPSVNLPSTSLPSYTSYDASTVRSSVSSLLSRYSSSSSMLSETHGRTMLSPKPEIV
ncbi:hypothetical protein R1sor_002652 [Riccia sorocarpa]|uniref:C2H2-type domain-containing protein n=1 Tax=Riccia sorocarpa TaxID=122646 RepID=A0ABD3GZD7_9MARC